MANADRIRFATFFPGSLNIHLIKDIGMIPYILQREYGYDACLITYKNEEYTYLSEVPGLRILALGKGPGYWITRALKKIFNRESGIFKHDSLLFTPIEGLCIALDSLPLMLKYGKSIDVLQLYHFKEESMLMALIYRIVNKKGIIYMKLDMDPGIIDKYGDNMGKKDSLVSKLSYRLIKSLPINIFSVESGRVYEFMRTGHPLFKRFSDRVCYIPNGVDMKRLPAMSSAPKERIVLHVGRIGNYQKRSEVVLEAFQRVAKEFPDWKLALVGRMEGRFKDHLEDFLHRHEDIRDRVLNVGFLESRDELFKWYGRSKIFAIPSLFESFGLVVVEAQLYGDVVLGSDIGAVRELTNDGELGFLCPVNDVDCFAKTLRHMMLHEEELTGRLGLASEFVRKNFDWNVICGNLDEKIRGEMAG